MRVALDNETILRNTAKRAAAERSSTVGDIVLELAHAGHLAQRRYSKWCLTPVALFIPCEPGPFRYVLPPDVLQPLSLVSARLA